MNRFEGSMTALATPFRNGALDEDAYRGLIRYQLDNGTAGLVPMGTTGEAATMSAEERFRAVKLAVETAAGKALVIGGAGSNGTQETIEGVRRVREAGADAALLVTPYYNKPTQQGLYEHYRAVARAHPGFPLVAYNVPGRTGVDLLPETCLRLCDVREVVALKEATGLALRALDIYEKCGERMTLLSGDDFIVAPFIACGGKGVISVSSNVAPKQRSARVAGGLRGAFAPAGRIQLERRPLPGVLFVESTPIPVKGALPLRGRFSA